MEFLSDVGGGEDRHRPSFFELAAQEQLRDLLAPVVRYILSVCAQRNPRYLLRIVNRHDEFFAVVMFFVERHYLKAWGASFAENFYGLKRRRVLGTGSDKTKAAVELTGRSEKLGKNEIRTSLVFLILVPYFRSKAQDLYERLGGGVDSDLFSDTPAGQRSQLRTPPHSYLDAAYGMFRRGYPYANAAYELYLLSYNVRYLFNKSPYWRPWLSWMSVEVRRMSADDYRAAHETTSTLLSSPIRRHHTTGLLPSYATIFRRSLSLVPLLSFEALKFLLPTSIFFFRFLEWWYSSDGGYGRLRRKGGAGVEGKALRAPPPAPSSKNHAVEKGLCCVHDGPMVNPTALPTGWLGCYKCLHGWVEHKGVCPVTGSLVALRELRKILG
ncbi:BQ2448_5740 [Microbotryum intermedium]|uniref:Peroxisome assembly protein 12 n=1 Tax=Microbotryum intermedium TaxID=269621 RepID=A0A238F5M0_9BASI|nr:BQ2448_5740 [Microbotryum intermedium]